MLKSLDVLIGFSLVMLLASMAVTFLTQVVVEVLNTRGAKLRDGLASLLCAINPAALEPHAREIARCVLMHPLIGGGKSMGSVIQREELVEVLLEFASSKRPPAAISAAAREALRKALEDSGVPDPESALRAIRSRALQLETERPEWATYVRRGKAIAETVSSEMLRDATVWFDSTMDRVSHSFQRHIQVYTAAFSLLLALGLQLDAFGLLNRLSLDENLRRTLVTEASSFDAKPIAPRPGDEDRTLLDRRVRDLREMALSPLVIPPERWLNEWSPWKLPGILLAALLLNLGAPFWYDQLKNLLRLRPLLAARDEAERQERRMTQGQPGNARGIPASAP